ncbi:nuclear transport factor 2 family protein [Aestuariibacter halophilus]|uniref:Nuclear transport factor 2 family protein n=1 Tax=Fluctibacter halophilus TaxID=226011 RepID=A0ABS8GC86_9ALTE|nr:nuclear transport factor 2 family protein [Aestuariibacter halophilus]MCC2618118.1 nuclear transport factor 2 family protein [Aestuariibacter halophilus]
MRYIRRIVLLALCFTLPAQAENAEQAITQAVTDYIESQIHPDREQMARGLDPALKKRTYWHDKNGQPMLLETDYDTMLEVAETYNANGDKFPAQPRIEIDILDIDQRAASVKLTVDDWIDYMHLYRTDEGQWKIINVLWQFHDTSKHG